MSTALVLMAHGSRQSSANDDLVDLADRIRGMGRYALVVASFLELAEPDIKTACRNCVAEGAAHVIMLPYFLSAGVHMLRDLARLRDELANEYPSVQFILGEPLGRHPLLMEVVLQRAAEANELSTERCRSV
jgi:sirohydrochlorin ferrochelatase